MADLRFDGMRAMFVHCTLKRSPERSHTQAGCTLSGPRTAVSV